MAGRDIEQLKIDQRGEDDDLRSTLVESGDEDIPDPQPDDLFGDMDELDEEAELDPSGSDDGSVDIKDRALQARAAEAAGLGRIRLNASAIEAAVEAASRVRALAESSETMLHGAEAVRAEVEEGSTATLRMSPDHNE